MPTQRGFTMVELVVTMIIIGIMAIAVVPRMDLLRGFDEIGFRDQVKGTLEYARKSAVAGRRNVQDCNRRKYFNCPWLCNSHRSQ
jgi:prepilin-type N-terminal cleavage/methylation domain-containing protein